MTANQSMVNTHVSGSPCVIHASKQHYLETRLDVRNPGIVYVEVVRSGQVYHRKPVIACQAGDYILEVCKTMFCMDESTLSLIESELSGVVFSRERTLRKPSIDDWSRFPQID